MRLYWTLTGLASVSIASWLEVGSPWLRTAVAAVVVASMFGDTFKGGVDMASASMKYLYSKASNRLGISSFAEDELTDAEKARRIERFRGTFVGGLYNEGNTCFINSVVQSLASCDQILAYVDSIGSGKSNFSAQLHHLIHDLNRIRQTPHNYATNALMSNVGGQARWSRFDQEDAQEFFQQLLLALEKDWKSANAPDSGSDSNEKVNTGEVLASESKSLKLLTPFDGAYAVRVGCLNCGDMEGIREGVVSSIDLGLDSQHQEFTLTQLLQDYCNMETIPEVECYRCTLVDYKGKLLEKLETAPAGPLATSFQARVAEVDAALREKVIDDKRYTQLKAITHKTLGDKTKQTMFADPMPAIMMIHINRSVFDMRTGFSRKNYAPVEFPIRLDMSPFVTDPQDPANHDPSRPMRGTPGAPQYYRLKATVIHYGSANFGHYVCFRKFNGFWWRISDDAVDLTTEAQVLGAQGVFMLFYEKETAEDLQADNLSEAVGMDTSFLAEGANAEDADESNDTEVPTGETLSEPDSSTDSRL